MTSDNDFEFADYTTIKQKLNCDFYFAHPYSSWERGLNENTTGLIRQYISKKTITIYIMKDILQTLKLNSTTDRAKGSDFIRQISIWSVIMFLLSVTLEYLTHVLANSIL